MKRNNKHLKLTGLITGLLIASCNLYAMDIEQSKNGIAFNSLEQSNYQLTLISPNKERHAFQINNGKFILLAADLGLKSFSDGQYKYELTPIMTAGSVAQDVRNLDNSAITEEFIKNFSSKQEPQSGMFSMTSNKLVEKISEEGLVKTFFGDDVIIDGSACIGMDCANGESFGFDTLRLKENNLRIKFDDTSSGGGSFPNNDWQLTANDSSNGGANRFSIDDITNGKTPFTVEANSPTNTLYVDSTGRIGVKTNSPSVDIHIKEGNTPTLRLEQDGSNGFTPQVWDVAGNETNFFVRDVTNGSSLPFRIKPGAPDSSLFVAADGDVGISTSSPAANLHVLDTSNTSTASNPQLLINNTNGTTAGRVLARFENNGPAFVDLSNSGSGQTWRMRVDGTDGFGISLTGDADDEFFLTDNGNLTISGTLTTTGTTCSSGCDLVFSDDYKLPSIEEHAAEMWGNNYLPSVGATIENAPFNITEKTTGMLNELEKAHIYIEQLNSRINNKDNELNAMKLQFENLEQKLINDFEHRLAKLEQK